MVRCAAKTIMLLLIVLCLALSGCSNNGQKPNIQDINIALQHEPYKLDPYYAETRAERQVFQSIFDKLVNVDEKGNIIAELADAWDISADGKVYTFYLHKGVKFHDGTLFNAEAVKFNLERYQESGIHQGLQFVSNIEVVDEYVVRLFLDKPFTPLLYVLADKSGMMCSPAAVRSHGVQFMNSPVGTGPYIFKTRVRGNSVTLSANTHYWREGEPAADSLTYKIIPNEKTALVNLRSGMIDLSEHFPLEELKNYAQHEKVAVKNTLGTNFTGIVLNLTQKPFHDERVRQAVNLLIDKKMLVENNLPGAAVSKCSPFAVQEPLVSEHNFNIAEAKKLLALAGYTDGFHIILEIDTNPLSLDIAKNLQQMLKEGNIDVEIEKQDVTALMRRMERREYQSALLHIEGRVDPDQNLYERFHTGGRFNCMGYSNNEVDILLEQARCMPDSPARKDVYASIMQKILADSPFIYLYNENNVQGVSKRLQGISTMPDGMINTSFLHK